MIKLFGQGIGKICDGLSSSILRLAGRTFVNVGKNLVAAIFSCE